MQISSVIGTLIVVGIFYVVGNFFYKLFTGNKGKSLYCASCGFEGAVKNKNKGSMLLELVLWLCLIVPGLIYSLWRVTTKHGVCRVCGSTHVIPANSPVALKAKKQA